MFLDSNRKGPQNKNDQEHVNTLGDPLATEEEWLHASDNLGEFKPKATATDQRQQRTKFLGEATVLAAIGLGIFGLINFSQPSHIHEVAPTKVQTKAPTVDIDFGPYMAELQRNIKSNWHPPKHNESKRVVVVFKVSKAGELSKLKLHKSSGVALADQAALKAVEAAAPEFGALPEGAPDNVDIMFTFDYNVFDTPKPKTEVNNDNLAD